MVLPAAAVAAVALLGWLVVSAAVPLPEDLGVGASTVHDRHGEEVGSLATEATHHDVAIEDLPVVVPRAVMAAEDRTFTDHAGISPTGIARALFTNVRAGEVAQGGSTITQQYLKNAVVGSERSWLRKAREAALAIKLEQQFDKSAILQMYLNTIYWGRGAYGIEAAAQTYFGVPATELTLNQAATLAGMIQAPERLDPGEAPAAADQRRRYVLDGMLESGWVGAARHGAVLAAGLPPVAQTAAVAHESGAYYLDAVRRELAGTIGEADLHRGLEIHTAMDPDLQAAAEDVIAEALTDRPYTGALVSVDPRTGGVRALVGGPGYGQQPFNTAVRSMRQVGSAFKPITLAAFVEGGWSPASQVDAPACVEVDDPSASAGTRELCNHDRTSHGTIDLYDATAASVNTAWVAVQQHVGTNQVIDMAEHLGLPADRPGLDTPVMDEVASLTLGTASFSPLELASAYGTFAADGVHADPHLVTRVETADGDLLYQAPVDDDRVLDPDTAAVITDVLTDVIDHGTGTAAAIDRPAAGKTGTTSGYVDAWFVGYVPQLTTSVWIGNLETTTPLAGELTGGSVPARTWGEFMARALDGVEVVAFPAADPSRLEVLDGAAAIPAPSGARG